MILTNPVRSSKLYGQSRWVVLGETRMHQQRSKNITITWVKRSTLGFAASSLSPTMRVTAHACKLTLSRLVFRLLTFS